ncbi:aminodeoxychorismate lyase [Alkalihalobacillus sp. FSL W8-0930]
MFVYLNGKYVDESIATVSLFDHGFLYGLGLFETFRLYNGHPFLLDDHFQRMGQGLEQIGIDWTISKDQATDILQELARLNKIEDAYVRWNVSAGDEGLGLYTGRYLEPTVAVMMKPLPPLGRSKAISVLKLRRNTPEGEYRLKSHHYLNNVLAKRELGPVANTEGIFLTQEGWVAEGVTSNIFWLKGDTVYTPSLDTGILDGITRQYVMALLIRQGVQLIEGMYPHETLLEADAVFLTNSIQEIVKVESCDVKQYKDHSLLDSLQQVYKKEATWRWSIAE